MCELWVGFCIHGRVYGERSITMFVKNKEEMKGFTYWNLCTFDMVWMNDVPVANAKVILCLTLGDMGNQPERRVDNNAT